MAASLGKGSGRVLRELAAPVLAVTSGGQRHAPLGQQGGGTVGALAAAKSRESHVLLEVEPMHRPRMVPAEVLEHEGVDADVRVQALGKAQAALQTDGFAQIVLDKRTGQVLGAQVVGHEASSLIAEMAIVIANELTVECITETIHAHPTIAEVWMEAAFIGQEAPLHWPPKKLAKK